MTEVLRDPEGYLVNPEEWTEQIAKELAQEEGIELSDEYWPIITFMRASYLENGVIPDVRHVIKELVNIHGVSKKEGKQLIFRLFPYGYVKQACKISGMKRPRGWSTG